MQFNPSDRPDSDFCILLFLLDDFWEMAAPAGLLFALFGASVGHKVAARRLPCPTVPQSLSFDFSRWAKLC